MKKKGMSFRFMGEHIFFFVALVVNYTWRYLQDFTFNSFHSFWNFATEVKPDFLSEGLLWWPQGLGSKFVGWSFDTFISVVVWLLSLYSLYLLYLLLKERKQVVPSLILLIFGILFYLITIFYWPPNPTSYTSSAILSIRETSSQFLNNNSP